MKAAREAELAEQTISNEKKSSRTRTKPLHNQRDRVKPGGTTRSPQQQQQQQQQQQPDSSPSMSMSDLLRQQNMKSAAGASPAASEFKMGGHRATMGSAGLAMRCVRDRSSPPHAHLLSLSCPLVNRSRRWWQGRGGGRGRGRAAGGRAVTGALRAGPAGQGGEGAGCGAAQGTLLGVSRSGPARGAHSRAVQRPAGGLVRIFIPCHRTCILYCGCGCGCVVKVAGHVCGAGSVCSRHRGGLEEGLPRPGPRRASRLVGRDPEYVCMYECIYCVVT